MHMLRMITMLIFIGWGSLLTTHAQRPTNTPRPVTLPQSTPLPTEIQLMTPTPSATPTPRGPAVVLRASGEQGSVNVRNFPDVSGARLGSLDPTRAYPVTGYWFSWYQFEYPASETGLAWVFGEVVTVEGDVAALRVVDPNVALTQAAPTTRGGTPTPGTVSSSDPRAVVLPTNANVTIDGVEFAPTFTPPSDLVPLRPTVSEGETTTPTTAPALPVQVVTAVAEGNIPPIAPIAILAGLGFIGLLYSAIRE